MASIEFDALLKTDKLEAEIKRSSKTVGTWAKDIEKAGGLMDQAIAKTTKNTKEAVKEQQALIKSLEGDINRIESLMTSATSMAKNKGLFAELSQMKKELAVEQGKLNELQNQGTQQDEKEVVSKNKIISALGKWAAGLFTVGAALKVAKDIINSTEGSASKFNETVGLLTGGIQGLYRTIITRQWDQLITNIVNAAKATRDLREATSELEHITAGGTIKRAELRLKLEEARTKAWEAMSPQESTKFYDQAESYQKQITELNVGEIKKRLVIDEDYYFKLTGHSREYYDYLLKQIPNIAKDYEGFYSRQEGYQIRLGQLKYLATAQSGGLTKAQEKERHELQLMTFALEDYKVLQEDLSKKGQWDEYIKGIGDMTEAAAAGQLSLVLLAKYKSMAAMKIMTEEKAAAKKAIEDAKTESKIKAQQELLDKAIESGNASEIKAIGERIRKLQEELVVRERIANAAIAASMTRDAPISKITGLRGPALSGGVKIPGTLSGKPTQDSGDYVPGTVMLTEAGKAKQKKKDAEYDKDAEDSLKRQLELRNEIVNAAASLINQIGQQIGLDERSMSLLNAGLDAFTALATKGAAGIPQAALALLSGIIAQIPSAASRFEAQISHINQLLEEQARLIELSEQVGKGDVERNKNLDLLEKEKAALIARRDHIQKYGGGIFWTNTKTQKEIEKLNDQIKETGNLIDDANTEYNDFLTGTTASQIADSIMQGFQDGKTSAADFADTFNGFMTDAINTALRDALLVDLEPWYAQLAADMESGGELTDEEKKNLKIWYDQIIADSKARRDAAESISGIDMNANVAANAGLTGIVRNISEDTGSELAGLFRRFADEQRVVKDYSVLGVAHLVNIEKNTYDTVMRLDSAIVELKSIVTNTKQIPVGSL